jgi:hypothetical protein
VRVPDLIGGDPGRQLLEVLALGLGVLAVVVLRRWPRLAVVGYLAVLALVPVWAGVQIKVFFEPQVLVGLLVLVALWPQSGRPGVRPLVADGLLALFVLASLAPLLTGGSTLTSVFVVAVQWLGAYLVGRHLGARTGYDWCLRVIAVVFTLVAALALVEYATGVDLFLAVPGSGTQHDVWATIQTRGGVARAEGAFGHSIALGAALSMAVPLTLGSSFRLGVRLPMVLLMTAGVVVTFSRIGLVCTALGIVLSVLSLRELPTRLRVLLAGSVAVVGFAVAPLVTRVFGAAGSEAANSASYRGDLLGLIGDMRPLGLSGAFHRAPDGDVFFGGFRSIDSALILQGLTYGWVSLVVALVLLAVGVLAVLTRRASAPTVALVAQVPALATVALITQYSTMVFFVGGLAVFAQAVRRPAPAGTGADDAVGPVAPAGAPRLAASTPLR